MAGGYLDHDVIDSRNLTVCGTLATSGQRAARWRTRAPVAFRVFDAVEKTVGIEFGFAKCSAAVTGD